jgi:hypothetical protein
VDTALNMRSNATAARPTGHGSHDSRVQCRHPLTCLLQLVKHCGSRHDTGLRCHPHGVVPATYFCCLIRWQPGYILMYTPDASFLFTRLYQLRTLCGRWLMHMNPRDAGIPPCFPTGTRSNEASHVRRSPVPVSTACPPPPSYITRVSKHTTAVKHSGNNTYHPL